MSPAASGGAVRIPLTVQGPLGDPVVAEYAVMAQGTAVIEMARASGLTLVSPELRNPLNTSSFGTGELIADALRRGCRSCIIGLGGSATNDAGTGMLAALGWRFLDRDGHALPPVGASLGAIVSIDDSRVPASLRPGVGQAGCGADRCRFTVACDVDTPFCGPDGAAAVFAPQKGADAEAVARLEAGMQSFATVIAHFTGVDVRRMPGAGAAGGLGGALAAFLGAVLKPGAELVLDAAGFREALSGADLVITGEGRLDAQTARGKLPFQVLRRAAALGIPTLAIAGQLGPGAAGMASAVHGTPADAAGMPADGPGPRFSAVLCVTPEGMPLETAMRPEVALRNIREALRRFLS
jgi:glycerate kinase